MCGDLIPKLIGQTELQNRMWAQLDEDGWPNATPRVLSEYGFSAFSGRAESELPSALLTAQIAGQWLSLGGAGAYMFGYPPNWPATDKQTCAGYGNMMLFIADHAGQAVQPMPNYYAARLLTQVWTQPGGGVHRVIPATFEGAPDSDVAAYALRRPDGRIAVLLVNRSASRAHAIAVEAQRAGGQATPLAGPASVFSYGPQQYTWIDLGEQSRPGRDRAPARHRVGAGPLRLALAPSSVTVVVRDARS